MNSALRPNGLANQNDLIPPSNYLWRSPDGVAYPGWHHQLILHLAAHKQGVWSQPTFAEVGARLAQYPDYAMDDNSLNAIIQEYLKLNLQTKWAYRDMNLNIPALAPASASAPAITISNQSSTDVNMDDEMDVDWESIIDPALFDHSDQSSTPARDPWSSPPPGSGSTAATQYGEVYSKPIGRNVTEQESPINRLHSRSGRELRQLKNWNTSSPITPTKPISLSTPSRPYPDRFGQEQYHSISPTPRSTNPSYTIDRDIGRILFFAEGIHGSRKQSTMAEPNKPDEMRLPDPTRYIQTSKKHYTIPESEAAAFMYWFELQTDPMPDKIEGHYWYCDKCYVGEVNSLNGGNIRGKFNQRRSVEKHIDTVHRTTWKPALPELDRNVAVKDADVEDVEYHGAASVDTPRRRLFSSEVDTGEMSGRARGEMIGGEHGDSGGRIAPTTKVKRNGTEVRLEFVDINQIKESEKRK